MKRRIISALLALACILVMALSVVSCGGDDGVNVKDFKTAISQTNPSSAEISIGMSAYPLTASLKVAFNEDGSLTVNYSYDKYNTTSEGGADEAITTVTGSATCDKDGNWSNSAIASLMPESVAVAGFNLDTSKMEAKISPDGNVLTATVKAENTEAVLGVEFEEDVTLVLTKNGETIISASLTYVSEATGTVSVSCTYK